MQTTTIGHYVDNDAEFIPQILRDFEAGKYSDMLVAIGGSSSILAEAALFIMERRGSIVTHQFLETVKRYTA